MMDQTDSKCGANKETHEWIDLEACCGLQYMANQGTDLSECRGQFNGDWQIEVPQGVRHGSGQVQTD